MSQTFELAQSRLDNIKAIEPLLSALRTISMGNWQMALKNIAGIKDYEKNFNHILMEVLPHIEKTSIKRNKQETSEPSIADTIILIVGSERGLCGNFNESVAKSAREWIKTKNYTSFRIWGLGSRMIQSLERIGIDISLRISLPAGNLMSYQQSFLITQEWITQYEKFDFNQLFVLFNQIEKGQNYTFAEIKLLPYEIHHSSAISENEQKRWPPAIIETGPQGIYHQIIQHYIASSFYQILLKSAAAEHAARYRLMYDAQENAEDIINEMNQTINMERKKRITQQMQELAAGAGLLDNK